MIQNYSELEICTIAKMSLSYYQHNTMNPFTHDERIDNAIKLSKEIFDKTKKSCISKTTKHNFDTTSTNRNYDC